MSRVPIVVKHSKPAGISVDPAFATVANPAVALLQRFNSGKSGRTPVPLTSLARLAALGAIQTHKEAASVQTRCAPHRHASCVQQSCRPKLPTSSVFRHGPSVEQSRQLEQREKTNGSPFRSPRSLECFHSAVEQPTALYSAWPTCSLPLLSCFFSPTRQLALTPCIFRVWCTPEA
jgi:hypothetical protein